MFQWAIIESFRYWVVGSGYPLKMKHIPFPGFPCTRHLLCAVIKKTNLAFIVSYGTLGALPARIAATGTLLVLTVWWAEDRTCACERIWIWEHVEIWGYENMEIWGYDGTYDEVEAGQVSGNEEHRTSESGSSEAPTSYFWRSRMEKLDSLIGVCVCVCDLEEEFSSSLATLIPLSNFQNRLIIVTSVDTNTHSQTSKTI